MMKKIEAIIRKSKFREVKKTLIKLGVDNFSYWLVRNVGEGTESRVYRGVEYETSALERIHLTLIVGNNAKEVVQGIINSGITGEAGDGRVFVSDVTEAYQIITENDTDKAISLKK
jgi:nitrogen regulatory protein P-II 1